MTRDIEIPMYNNTIYCSSKTCKNYDCFRNPWNIPFGTDIEGRWVFYTDGHGVVWDDFEADGCNEYRDYWKKEPCKE